MITSVLLIAGLLILFSQWPLLIQRLRLKRWRKRLCIPYHHAQFRALFAPVNGFLLSKAARCKQDALHLVYGEIEFEPFIALLSLCRIDADTVFYDLGSGVGKAVLASAMVYDMKKYCGVELLKPLHDAAVERTRALINTKEYASRAKRISWLQNDILQTTLSDATLIFINATAFFGEPWKAISAHLAHVPPHTVVLTSSKPLMSDAFYLNRKTVVHMSWGTVTVYLHTRQST